MIVEPRDVTHFGGRPPANASGETRTRHASGISSFSCQGNRASDDLTAVTAHSPNRLGWEGRFFVDSGMGLFGYSSSRTCPNSGFPKREVGDSAPPKIDEVTLVRPFHGNL